MWGKQLEAAIRAAKDAEIKIKEIYATDFAVEIKSDDSPVTAADKGADFLIREELGKEFPEYGFLTEESADDLSRLSKKCIWIVDPVDGTKEFVSRNGEFTTNIALCENHEIVVGVINVPMRNVLYYAVKGEGAYRLDQDGKRTRISVSGKRDGLTVLRSRSFFNQEEAALIERHKDKIAKDVAMGAATKFCAIASGKAELSYRMSGGTKEWDIAAGSLILEEAGGIIVKPDGTHYSYNRNDVYNRDGYILANCRENVLL